jgi:hypothetical protein
LASLDARPPPSFLAGDALVSFGSDAILAENTPIRGFCPIGLVLDPRPEKPVAEINDLPFVPMFLF